MRLSPILLAASASLAASALLLTGCSAAAPAPASSGAKIDIVASTNVYGDIAQTVGGDAVAVTSIIDDDSKDPHEFEPSAADQLRVKQAQLLIENGGGYDPFFDDLIKASGSTAPLITAMTFSPQASSATASPGADDHGHAEGINEHVFYDVTAMGALATEIAARLSTIDPSRKDSFTANAKSFTDGVAGLSKSLATIAAAHRGQGVFVTEPLPLFLTEAAGLQNITPPEFSEAVEEGSDVPPATLLDALGLISGGKAKVVIVNAQAAGPETTQVEQKAAAANVPVLKFSELLPVGTTYLTWMQDNIAQLQKALG